MNYNAFNNTVSMQKEHQLAKALITLKRSK